MGSRKSCTGTLRKVLTENRERRIRVPIHNGLCSTPG